MRWNGRLDYYVVNGRMEKMKKREDWHFIYLVQSRNSGAVRIRVEAPKQKVTTQITYVIPSNSAYSAPLRCKNTQARHVQGQVAGARETPKSLPDSARPDMINSMWIVPYRVLDCPQTRLQCLCVFSLDRWHRGVPVACTLRAIV